MNELEKIITRYFSKSGTAITYSDFKQEEVNKLFTNMKSYERPDILSIYDNKIVAIEHFEFDSYKNNKKGSNYKIQENAINKKMETAIQSNLKYKGKLITHDTIENTSNLKQYYHNFKKVLLSHIENIPEYKEHIIQDFGNEKDIEIWFFAEDVTPLGNYCYKKEYDYPLLLLPFSKENIEILKSHREIKGIILGIYAMNEYKLVLMYNDLKTLEQFEKNEYFQVDETEFMSFNPHTTGFALQIPKEKLDGDINE